MNEDAATRRESDMETQAIAVELKQMIVNRLELKIDPASIQDEAPLFGDGLGLDSVESLELVVGIEETFGVVVDDSPEARKRFFSVATLSSYIADLKGGAQVSA